MSVYQPSDDSKLLAKAVLEKDLSGKRCLDMGTGSGIIARKMVHSGAEEVVAVDKNPEAVKEAKENLEDLEKVEVRESNLFSSVEGKFDLIAFNPPYLPDEEGVEDDDDLFGGESGEELTETFLERSGDYLSERGEVHFVVSSSSGFDVENYEIVDTEKLWFEDLYVLKSE
ncbi:MAG: HemK2/MTQ2 family protein methyltransferase [Candidatus Nanosalina sp.]